MAFFLEELKELLERGDELPTLPDVVLRLHRVLEDENWKDGQIAAIVERDPPLTARLLRVANSPLTRGGHHHPDTAPEDHREVARLVRAAEVMCCLPDRRRERGRRDGRDDRRSTRAIGLFRGPAG